MCSAPNSISTGSGCGAGCDAHGRWGLESIAFALVLLRKLERLPRRRIFTYRDQPSRTARFDSPVIACPSCKRRVITRSDIFYATLDCAARCRICGRPARLDVTSRWLVSCVIALLLPAILLMAGIFYSGHLLFISIVIVLGAWRLLCLLGLPLLALEPVPGNVSLDRMQSILTLAALLAAALVLDVYMASRFE